MISLKAAGRSNGYNAHIEFTADTIEECAALYKDVVKDMFDGTHTYGVCDTQTDECLLGEFSKAVNATIQ